MRPGCKYAVQRKDEGMAGLRSCQLAGLEPGGGLRGGGDNVHGCCVVSPDTEHAKAEQAERDEKKGH